MTPEPHPLNRSFAWSVPRGPFRRITPGQASGFDEQGFCVIEDALDADTVRSVTTEIDPWEAKVETALAAFPTEDVHRPCGRDHLTTHLVQRSERLRDFCASALFQDLGHDLVGPDVRLYWDQAVYKKPGTADEFPGTRTTGTPTSSRRTTSPSGSRSPTRRVTTAARGSFPACCTDSERSATG